MDKKHIIHLPNGKSYRVIQAEESPVGVLMEFMASQTAVTVSIELTLTTGKQGSLILWGDVLKNSYITIE